MSWWTKQDSDTREMHNSSWLMKVPDYSLFNLLYPLKFIMLSILGIYGIKLLKFIFKMIEYSLIALILVKCYLNFYCCILVPNIDLFFFMYMSKMNSHR